MKIFLTLLFLLLLETAIIFMLIEKNKSNNTSKDLPDYNPKIPLTLVINVYSKNTFIKDVSVDTIHASLLNI